MPIPGRELTTLTSVTLPFGTAQEVIDEVKESIDIYASTRWICGPCHNLQPVSPTENIVAMYETIHTYGT